MNNNLTIAVSKGRIFEEAMPLLAYAGIEPLEDPEASRKLIIPTTRDDVRLLIIRATDVPPYVENGGADMGIAGKDVLMEYDGDGLYEPIDLKIAQCRMMVAGKPGHKQRGPRLKIATKYTHTAKQYYADQGQQVDIIKLYGSMELAPLVGMADCIVDLVSTGGTLKANGLEAQEHICDISSRLVVNKGSMKMKHAAVQGILDQISRAVAERSAA